LPAFSFSFSFLLLLHGWIISIAEEVIPTFKPPALITKSPVDFFFLFFSKKKYQNNICFFFFFFWLSFGLRECRRRVCGRDAQHVHCHSIQVFDLRAKVDEFNSK
jgi:hypothetical protein